MEPQCANCKVFVDAVTKGGYCEPCAVTILEAENKELRVLNRQLLQRSSPAHQGCFCPEFCTAHPRLQFEHLRAALRDIAKNGHSAEDCAKASRALEELKDIE